jgi:2,3,4,5-tetrahydropyridine-2-carboxylate N-succinyltransferase
MYCVGLGVGTKSKAGEWLEVFYPRLHFAPDMTMLKTLTKAANYKGGNATIEVSPQSIAGFGNAGPVLAESKKPLVAVFLETDAPPEDAPQAYLKLHLLSHRLVKPHATNLTGLFKVLPNVAWTSQGAIAIDDLAKAQLKARTQGQVLRVYSVDKFPPMTDYVVPKGVRIADTARVRLGAYIGEGTTVMHEGFVNYNAGCAGPNMIEGRISAGVFVEKDSDLGGGCSTMGTLSGGGEEVISVGKNCLIGANAGIGIPLGDHCTIEAGLYVTAGAKVRFVDTEGTASVKKARELAGQSDLLFRRNSTDGAIECLKKRHKVALNDELHAHN